MRMLNNLKQVYMVNNMLHRWAAQVDSNGAQRHRLPLCRCLCQPRSTSNLKARICFEASRLLPTPYLPC
jgi:hypothetical protein